MKWIIISIITVFTFAVHAKKPFNLCSLEGYCSPEQQRIFNEFQDCNSFEPNLIVENYVWSGSCYHVGRGYQNDKEQFSMAYFKNINNDIRYVGSFSFFTGYNNYRDVTPEEANKKYTKSLNKKNKTIQQYTSEYGYRIHPNIEPDRELEYWLKTCNEKVLLLAHWGYQHRLTCELTKN